METFAESTIDATLWLMRYHPERLDAWLERHEPGLIDVARSRSRSTADSDRMALLVGAETPRA